jgi:hypothetical protein
MAGYVLCCFSCVDDELIARKYLPNLTEQQANEIFKTTESMYYSFPVVNDELFDKLEEYSGVEVKRGLGDWFLQHYD